MNYKRWVLKAVAYNLMKIQVPAYNTAVVKVESVQIDVHNIQAPGFLLTPTRRSRLDMPSNIVRYELTYTLVGVVRGEPADNEPNLDLLEEDYIKCHAADWFLYVAFAELPGAPAELSGFHLLNHTLGFASYVYKRDMAYFVQEATATYDVRGKDKV